MIAQRYNLNRLGYFAAAVEQGTITAAAAHLGLSKAVVSKQLQLLEDDIGVSLLSRNSRHLRLTQAGETFYAQARIALDQAATAFDTAARGARDPSGTIRVTSPVDYGMLYLAPFVADFIQTHPAIRIELVLSDDRFDPVKDRFDIAIRVGWLEDSSNKAKKLGAFREMVVCAADAPIAKVAARPSDLNNAPAISNAALEDALHWKFRRGNEVETATPNDVVRMNISLAIRDAMLGGTAIAKLPDFVVTKDIASGAAVQLLPDWTLREGGIFAVFPQAKFRTLAVETFTEAVIKRHRRGA